MRIGVDGHIMLNQRTGMGMVSYNVLKYWKKKENVELFVFVPELNDKEEISFFESNSIIVRELGKHNYFTWEQIILPLAVKQDHIDVLWCPYNTAPVFLGCKTVVTIHDMIFMDAPIWKTPSFYKKIGIVYRRLVVPIAARKADAITTVSSFSKSEILKFFPKAKVNVIYNAVEKKDCDCYIGHGDYFEEIGIKKKYILGIGSLEYRKNTLKVIQAYENLPRGVRNDYQLVLFGFRGFSKSYEKQYIKEKSLEEDVIVLEYISEKDKGILYANSSIFLYPSLSEGFGIPILEAFSFEIPVITSCLSSMPEVAENAALYVDPYKKEDIKNAVLEVLNNSAIKEAYVQKGNERIKHFSWEKSADEYRSVFESVF